jgi:hypothetical protein
VKCFRCQRGVEENERGSDIEFYCNECWILKAKVIK